MPEYLSPGVYVEEVSGGSKAVEGVSTSTAAFLGETIRGPVEPRLITNYGGFTRTFGGSPESSNLAIAVKGFFDNGGSRCYVTRVTPHDPDDVAKTTVEDDSANGVMAVSAVGPGEWGESVAVIVRDSPLYKEG
ncbi:MAG: hypothetical protein R3324_19330, partial [Halobacteriales archaeon]|nr:hypothetical protein [Halobacteriales archaeon]